MTTRRCVSCKIGIPPHPWVTWCIPCWQQLPPIMTRQHVPDARILEYERLRHSAHGRRRWNP